jgi:hypothetical protein
LAGACDTVRLPVAVRHTLSVRYRRRGSCWILPPSFRFPPLCEGNRVFLPPSVRFPPLCEGNRATPMFGSPCFQGEPKGGGCQMPALRRGETPKSL